MKMHQYLIEAFDDAGGYLQQCVSAISEAEAECTFKDLCAKRCESFEVVEITLIRL